jgi:cell division protein FtsQ
MKGLRLGKKNKSRRDGKGSLKGPLRRHPIFLATFFFFIAAGALMSVWIYRASARVFPVTEVVFYGNTHLSDGELRAMTGISKHTGLLAVSSKLISVRLLQSPWIKNVCIRKDFPHRVIIKIHETSPFAILETKGRTFLIDEKGKMLEEMKDVVPFLPVITADPSKNRDSFIEALILARVLRERNIATERNRVEIVADKGPESISMVLDNVVIKMGQGDYEQKLHRLFALEDEIKKRSITVDYVDLRFANRVVIKPLSEVVR